MIYEYDNPKLFNAFQTAFLTCDKDCSVDFRDIVSICKEYNIRMDVISFFDYIKDEIDEWMYKLGLSYEDDKLYGIGLKPIINVKTLMNSTFITKEVKVEKLRLYIYTR